MLLAGHPNLLTYVLGEAYVSTHAEFKRVWDEVLTYRTYFELLEVVHPSVPLNARLEVVVTAADTSLSSFGHRRLTQTILRDGLLIKVRLRSLYHGHKDVWHQRPEGWVHAYRCILNPVDIATKKDNLILLEPDSQSHSLSQLSSID